MTVEPAELKAGLRVWGLVAAGDAYRQVEETVVVGVPVRVQEQSSAVR